MKDIVFVHGMFQNPKSWEKWINFFSERGYNCVAPAWPLHEGEPSNLRANPPAGLGDLSLNEIINEIEKVVLQHNQPIVIGHSVGGLIAQILVNRKIASIGVPISSVAPNGMLDFDWGFFKNSALIANPFKGNEPFFMDAEGFHGSFANTLAGSDAAIAFENFATHDSRNVLRDCMGEDGKIDLDEAHAPLLFIAGEKDEIIPYTLNEKNAKAYTDENSLIAYQMLGNRSHFICGEPGWEEVATTIYEWLETLPENK